jgi:16S rRNA (adenine1518-N6/adenine1519-N6)-dimethyltransferase
MKKINDLAQFASKKFGQNFLKDHIYIDQIIQAMPSGSLPVVEIGPGLGDLTTGLVKVRDVTAFEVDKRLCEHLRDQFETDISSDKLKLICSDALEHWEQDGLLDKSYDLVANLPYYLATHFILKALHDPLCQSILVMVQKEVALKFAAHPGERDFSALSVLAQSAGEARLLFDVPREAFVPPPNVTSAVLSIRKDRTLEDGVFEHFLKVSFAQPRKKLSKNLEQIFGKETIESAFEALDLDPLSRPHEATTSQYHQLYTTLKKDFKDGQEQSKPGKKQRRRAKKTQP